LTIADTVRWQAYKPRNFRSGLC